MEEKKKTIQFLPMTRTQAAIGGGALISFFALWFLWAAVGQSVICWIENHPGMASWVQAIGSLAAIAVTAFIARRDGLHRKTEQAAQRKDRNRKIRVHLAKNKFWSSVEGSISILEKWRKTQESPSIKIYGLKNLFILIQSTRAFNRLFNNFHNLNEDEKYFLQLSELGDDFYKIFRYVELLEYDYEMFHEFFGDFLDCDKNISFMRLVGRSKIEDLKNLENALSEIIISFNANFMNFKDVYCFISNEISENSII